MNKFKVLLFKYKYWVVGAVVAFIALYFLRGSSGGGGGGAIQTQYTTAGGSTANTYTDPSLMIAQLQAQTSLAMKAQESSSALQILQAQTDLEKFKTASSETLGLATIDANKWMANLESVTSNNVAQLGFNSAKYTADIQQQITNSNNILAGQQISSNNYIAQLNAETQKYTTDKQASIAKYQLQTERRGQDYGFVGGLLNFAGGFFK